MISVEELYEGKNPKTTVKRYVQEYLRVFDNLPRHYFSDGVIAFTRLMWEAFINPDRYWERRVAVFHEREHNLCPNDTEHVIRARARYKSEAFSYC